LHQTKLFQGRELHQTTTLEGRETERKDGEIESSIDINNT